MPLIRYVIGDLITVDASAYRAVYKLHGRSLDSLRSTSGRRVTVAQIDQRFAAADGIAHYQLCQEAPAQFSLQYVAESAGPTAAVLTRLRQELGALLGTETGLRLKPVDSVACENSGKFRLSKNLLS